MNKKLLAAAVAGALTVPMSAQAIQYKLSGHINRLVLFMDDGIASDVANVDNGASRSRVTITGSDSLGVGGIKAGVRMEWSVASNMSSNVTIKGGNGNGGGNDIAFDIRHSAIWFSGKFGKLTMGHTSGAYDGRMFADQSGTVAMASIENGAATFGGSIAWRTTGGGNIANGAANLTMANTVDSIDGGRYDLIRYDTPNFGPFSAALDIGDNQRWSIGAGIKTSLSGAKVRLSGGYENSAGNTADRWGIAGSVLFSQGTNLNIAYAEQDRDDARDMDNFYIKLGHRWGNNSAAIDYIQTEDENLAGDEHTSWGIGIAHNVPGPNVQFYAAYRNHDLDRTGVAVEDIDVFGIGSRVRF